MKILLRLSLFLVVILLYFLIWLVTKSHAQASKPQYDPNSEKSQWFNSLVVPEGNTYAGRLCCDTSDGFPVESEFKNVPSDDPDGSTHWYAKYHDIWTKVPDSIVLKTYSIDSKAYLFVYQGQKRCFVPPVNGY